VLLPAVVYDTILAALIGPLAISIHDRRIERSGSTGEHVPRRTSSLRRNLSRFLVFALAAVIAVTGLTARLFYLQIVDGGRLATLATRNRTVLESIPAPRGMIYDRNGRALVTNVATFVVKLRPA
jgi:cell division protein FtsI/penicillin-binding protein 2